MNRDLTFCVFHIGDTRGYVTSHVASLKSFYPTARVVFITDANSCLPPEVDECIRLTYPSESLMVSRIFAYQSFHATGPTFYLDCDMFPLMPMPDSLLAQFSGKTILCRRSFSRESTFNHLFGGHDYSIYKDMTLDQVFPILACFTYSESSSFWKEIMAIVSGLDPAFHSWYGDQEALKKWAIGRSGSRDIGFVGEHLVACLPEYDTSNSCFVHFKGAHRKTGYLPAYLRSLSNV